ncbi:hypothetical protein [Pseudomonas citronellolis]|uniref:hypothetical protein n=1 Tax=Pseudomonas citronellolis TaxID=53408 RepID=UPI00389AD86D
MHPLKRLVQGELHNADPGVLVETALNLWYHPDPMPLVLEVVNGLQEMELRRALYTLDRLRRYGTAMTERRYLELTELVCQSRWEPLKVVFVLSPPPPWGRSAKWPDVLAQGWGLGEEERLNTACILKYQTRHYAAEHRRGQN